MESNRTSKSIYIIGALFFIFGFATWINSVLIPYLKILCDLSDFQAYLVTFAFYISYFVVSIPSSWVLRRAGFVKGMSLGLLTMAAGSALFVPAAMSSNYLLFLVGLFAQGAGLALLQTASNPYVTILGPIESAGQRISIMGICNKMAGIIGIFLLSYLLFSDLSVSSENLAGRIIAPYIWITVILIILAIVVRLVNLPEIDPESNSGEGRSRKSIFSYPYFWFGVVSMFFYVGAEVIAIDTLPLYGQSQGIEVARATKLGTFGLIALTIGYLAGIILVPKYISQRKAYIVCILLAVLFLGGALLTKGAASIVFIVLLSLAHALMWPSMWPLAIENLGRYTQLGSAILIMSIAGGAVIPLIYGGLVDMLGGDRQIPYIILLPGYLFMLFFALRGYGIGRDAGSHM